VIYQSKQTFLDSRGHKINFVAYIHYLTNT